MIVSTGGDPKRTQRALGRAVEAIGDLPRSFTLPRAQARHERLRTGTAARGTVALAGALVDSLDRTRDDFLRAAFGGRASESVRIGALREGSNEDDDEQRILAAVDDMSGGDLAAVLAEAINLLYDQGVAHAQAEIGTSFSVDAARAKRAIDERGLALSKVVVDDERAALKAIIRDAFDGGSSVADIRAQVIEFFGEGVHQVVYAAGTARERVVPIDTWANTLARTEVALAQNAGIYDLYRDAGVGQVRWLTADDERTCGECAPLDGEVADLDQAFDGTDVAHPPLHPNCRCTIVDAESAQPTEQAPYSVGYEDAVA